MRVLRRLTFYLLYVGMTLAGGLISPFILPSKHACIKVARGWNWSALALAKRLLDIRLVREGQWPCTPAIYACKHQSALETFALWLWLDNPAFILKQELLSIPIFGWFLARTEPIAIDRSAGSSAIEQIASQGKARLEQGRSIVIFPEGTRRPLGAPPRYKSGGVWALYQLDAPLVPVALNTGALWPKVGEKQSGCASIKALKPLDKGLGKEALMQQLQETIEHACRSLTSCD